MLVYASDFLNKKKGDRKALGVWIALLSFKQPSMRQRCDLLCTLSKSLFNSHMPPQVCVKAYVKIFSFKIIFPDNKRNRMGIIRR